MLRRVVPLLIVTSLLAAGAVAWAALPSAEGTIHACYGKYGGVVRVIDPATQKCSRFENPISWSSGGATVKAVHAQSAEEFRIPTKMRNFLGLSLQPGSWVVSGTAQVANLLLPGERVPVVCHLDAIGASTFSSSWVTAGLAAFTPSGGGDNTTLPFEGVVAFETPGSVVLGCYSNTGDESKTAIIGHVQLTAVQVGSIEEQPAGVPNS